MIACEIKNRVAHVVIRRANDGNAFSSEMIRQLRDIFRDTSTADIMTLTGEGADFSLGRDRNEPKSGTPYEAFSLITDLNARMSDFAGVIISAIHGRAFGFGVGLVMRSDIAIASEDAVFVLDEVSLGIPPMFIMAAIGDHLAPKHAFDAILTSRKIDATEALRMGLVSRTVPPSKLVTCLDEVVAQLHARDRDVILACKRYLRAIKNVSPEARGAVALVEQTKFAMSKH
jgi:enoyl-CoA hydratase/carnithine racemase